MEFIYLKSSLGSRYSLLKPNHKLQGVSRSVRFKNGYNAAVAKKSLLISTGNKFCTFGIGICQLVYLGYPAALSMLGGEAHHRGAAQRFLKSSEIL